MVACVAELRDGRVVSSSDDSTLWVWEPDTGEHLDTFETTEINVSQMDLSKASLAEDLAILLWRNNVKKISDEDYEKWVQPRFFDRH